MSLIAHLPALAKIGCSRCNARVPDISGLCHEAMSTLVMRTLHQSSRYYQGTITSHANREAPSVVSVDNEQNSNVIITAHCVIAEAWRGLAAPPLDTSCVRMRGDGDLRGAAINAGNWLKRRGALELESLQSENFAVNETRSCGHGTFGYVAA